MLYTTPTTTKPQLSPLQATRPHNDTKQHHLLPVRVKTVTSVHVRSRDVGQDTRNEMRSTPSPSQCAQHNTAAARARGANLVDDIAYANGWYMAAQDVQSGVRKSTRCLGFRKCASRPRLHHFWTCTTTDGGVAERLHDLPFLNTPFFTNLTLIRAIRSGLATPTKLTLNGHQRAARLSCMAFTSKYNLHTCNQTPVHGRTRFE